MSMFVNALKCIHKYLVPSAVVLTGEVRGRSLGRDSKTFMNEEARVILLISTPMCGYQKAPSWKKVSPHQPQLS